MPNGSGRDIGNEMEKGKREKEKKKKKVDTGQERKAV